MRIFGWMQSKLSGRHQAVAKKPELTSDDCEESCNEELRELSGAFLAIGTLGNNSLRVTPEKPTGPQEGPAASSEDYKSEANQNFEIGKDKEKAIDGGRQTSSMVVPINGKDNFLENNNGKNVIGKKKSLSLVLKRMFVCNSGFTPPLSPSLRDPMPESRMENILWSILRKKIYPQGSSSIPKLSAKKYLRNRDAGSCISRDDAKDNGSKWVKTDSEYIVLEI